MTPPARAFTTVTACRICGHRLADVLAFGDVPLANELVADRGAAERQDRFPLTLACCDGCGLVQLREAVDPARLFRDYVYLSSNSASFVAHAATLAGRLLAERGLGPDSTVMEIASNDGYLLQHYARAGVGVLGIDPAVNVAAIARSRGVETIAEFFDADLARQLARNGRRANVLHANNVLAHVPSPPDLVAGMRDILAVDGIAVVEVPYLGDFLARLEFDTVYHEHQCYFALTPLIRLFGDAGLEVFDVERLTMHGGSLRLFVRHRTLDPPSDAVAALLADERQNRVAESATCQRFARRVADFRRSFREYVLGLKAEGRSVAAYGASAKGATLLNYCAIGADTLDFVADLSPLKQGRCMPGVGIPIVAPAELLVRQPDYVVLLAWNFADEIARQQSEYLRRGGRFVIPVPEPRLIAPEDRRP